MPKKKKSDNWQRDCLEKEKNIKRSQKKRGNVIGNVVAQKKKGNITAEGREKKEKKFNLNWGYLYKVHLAALFHSHFPPKLGG